MSSQDRTPLEKFVDGFPISLAKETKTCPMLELWAGRDIAAYFNMRASEHMNTSILPSRQPPKPLEHRPMAEVGQVKATTEHDGELTLDEFLSKSHLYCQGFLVVHKGEIVYEKYPRMKPEDLHLWMSCQKTQAGLIIDLLVEEGKIDPLQPITKYVTGWKGTEWDNVIIKDIMDMAAGMDLEDTSESRFKKNAVAMRVYQAEMNYPNPPTGKIELLEEVLKTCPRLHGPGEKFEYSSAYTQCLVFLAEAVTEERWAQTFDKMVWSKVHAEGPMCIHTSPDGIAAAHGLASSCLRDMARFGMLYTPSWNKAATEQVVKPELLDRIFNEQRSHDFLMKGFDGQAFKNYLRCEDFVGNSHQWDCVWPEGDMWKGGLMTQGLYVSPKRDLVIVYMSVNNDDHSAHAFNRSIAVSGLFPLSE